MQIFFRGFILSLIFISNQSKAQLTGIKSIPGDYSCIAVAINALNTQGVGNGGVIFNVGAGIAFEETVPTGGIVLGSAILNSSLNSTNTLVIQKASTALANPLITSYTGGTSTPATASAFQDGIFRLRGCDFVTINGIDLKENALNTTNPSTMEYGYAMYKANVGDGCQNNTIKNCTITLNRINNATAAGIMLTGSVGILIINSKDSFPTVGLAPTTAPGANANNRIYNNTIQNCNIGIGVSGYAAAIVAAIDVNNDIGGQSAATANMIINYGGGSAATNPAYGIQTLNQRNLNISYNLIDNNNGSGVNHPLANLYGIYSTGGTNGSADLTHNVISLKSNAISHYVFGIAATYVGGVYENVAYNTITNCSCSSMTTGFFYGISATGPLKVYINNNTIDGIAVGASVATPQVYPQVYGIYSYSGSIVPDSVFANGNQIKNITITCNSFGYLTGLSINAGKVHRATGNTLSNFMITGTGTGGSITGMLTANAYYTNISTVNYEDNNISYFSIVQSGINPGGSIIAMSNTYQTSYGISFRNNVIHHMQGNGAVTINGINIYAGSNYNNYISGNNMHTFVSNGGSIVGVTFSNSGRLNFFKNKFYDFLATGANGNIKGVYIASNTDTCQFYNNYIGDLRTPAASSLSQAITGINIQLAYMITKLKVYNNTIMLDATSTGVNFGTTVFFHGANSSNTINAVTLKNNIFINTSISKGTGKTIVLERNLATLANYSTSSNNNVFYAGEPSNQQLIYFDGINADQTLASFITRVGPVREINSLSIMPNFISTTGSDDLYLHLDPLSNCDIIGKGNNETFLLSEDFDAQPRMITSPFTIDIGADETGKSNIWTGNNGTAWTNAANWSEGIVPDDLGWNIVIPAGSVNEPLIDFGESVQVKSINIAAGILLSNRGTLKVGGFIMAPAASINNMYNGTTEGSIEMNGMCSNAQTISGKIFYLNNIRNLIIGTDVLVSAIEGEGINITGTLSFGGIANKTLYTGDNIYLKSTATATANVADITGNVISGKVTVERYVNTGLLADGRHPKSWQFLAAPTKGQTIFQSWQENGTILPGFGTIITGTGNGFDITTAQPSMKFFDPATGSEGNWIGVTNTGNNIQDPRGYMLFVRGDRSVTTSNGTPNPTTLRTKGSLFQPTDAPPSTNVLPGKLASVGNPYASAIDISYMAGNGSFVNLDNNVIVWDPLLNGSFNLGGYQALSAANNYEPTAGGTSYYPAGVASPFIQSGQAFFVRSSGQAGSVTFSEACKTASNRLVNRSGLQGRRRYFRATLFTSTGIIADGNAVVFDNDYRNRIDENDALKISNSGENVGILKEGRLLAVDARGRIEQRDSIFYSTCNLRIQSYRFCFSPKNMSVEGLRAYLVDTYLQTRTSISLVDSSWVNFTITQDPSSASPTRFYVVFKISEQKKNISIRSVENISMNKSQPKICVYPNPIVNNCIRLQCRNVLTGKYQIQLLNNAGQVLFREILWINESNALKMLKMVKNIPPGDYLIQLINPVGDKQTISVFFQ